MTAVGWEGVVLRPPLRSTVLGNLLGIAQIDSWCEWFSDVVEDYWAQRLTRSAPAGERLDGALGPSHFSPDLTSGEGESHGE